VGRPERRPEPALFDAGAAEVRAGEAREGERAEQQPEVAFGIDEFAEVLTDDWTRWEVCLSPVSARDGARLTG
jgi:hypothetical protein